MHIENRAAENGGQIIDDQVLHEFTSGQRPVMAVAIVDTVILVITSSDAKDTDDPEMVNLGYYDTKTVVAGEFIYGNIASVHLTSGVLQVIF